MRNPIAEMSPAALARTAAVLGWVDLVATTFAVIFVGGKLVVAGDAAATATNIVAHQTLYRLGAAAWLIALPADAAGAMIFYELLKPVGRRLAMLLAFFRLMFVAVMASNSLNLFAPLSLLQGRPYLSVFRTDQLQALALVAQSAFATGFGISMVFWGFHIILMGWLILRSAFLPRGLGALLVIGGVCYLINSFAGFLAPSFASALGYYIMVPGGAAEILLLLWLLVMGVNVERWKEQATVRAGL